MADNPCSYPGCGAGLILEEIRNSNKEYRTEIKDQLGHITRSIEAVGTLMRETMKSNGVIEQAIVYLRQNDERNEKAHDILFTKINRLTDMVIEIRDESQSENMLIRKELNDKIDNTVSIRAVVVVGGIITTLLAILTLLLNKGVL